MWGDGERREREGGKERGGVMGRGEGEGRRGDGMGWDGEGRGRGPRFLLVGDNGDVHCMVTWQAM